MKYFVRFSRYGFLSLWYNNFLSIEALICFRINNWGEEYNHKIQIGFDNE